MSRVHDLSALRELEQDMLLFDAELRSTATPASGATKQPRRRRTRSSIRPASGYRG